MAEVTLNGKTYNNRPYDPVSNPNGLGNSPESLGKFLSNMDEEIRQRSQLRPSETPAVPLDYEKMLRLYMRFVLNYDGSTFTEKFGWPPEGLSEAEAARILEMAVEEETDHYGRPIRRG